MPALGLEGRRAVPRSLRKWGSDIPTCGPPPALRTPCTPLPLSQTLLHVRERLRVPCPSNLATNDLETEIFLHLLHQHQDAVAGVSADTFSAAEAAHGWEGGDGMALPQ